jgi:hypothetical protein
MMIDHFSDWLLRGHSYTHREANITLKPRKEWRKEDITVNYRVTEDGGVDLLLKDGPRAIKISASATCEILSFKVI